MARMKVSARQMHSNTSFAATMILYGMIPVISVVATGRKVLAEASINVFWPGHFFVPESSSVFRLTTESRYLLEKLPCCLVPGHVTLFSVVERNPFVPRTERVFLLENKVSSSHSGKHSFFTKTPYGAYWRSCPASIWYLVQTANSSVNSLIEGFSAMSARYTRVVGFTNSCLPFYKQPAWRELNLENENNSPMRYLKLMGFDNFYFQRFHVPHLMPIFRNTEILKHIAFMEHAENA